MPVCTTITGCLDAMNADHLLFCLHLAIIRMVCVVTENIYRTHIT